MIENYREHEEFKPTYSIEDVPQTLMPVIVMGIDEQDAFPLGVGDLIGSIKVTALGETFDMPVIEVSDVEDGLPYTLLGLHCFWSTEIPSEMTDDIASGNLVVNSVRRYIEDITAEDAASEQADMAWLEDNSIDPDSL